MEIVFSKGSKQKALTLKNAGEEIFVTNSFIVMAQFLTEEYPDETESMINNHSESIALVGFDSEAKEQIHNVIFRVFCQENNPCSELHNEEW